MTVKFWLGAPHVTVFTPPQFWLPMHGRMT
jgi:hypothetical protein